MQFFIQNLIVRFLTSFFKRRFASEKIFLERLFPLLNIASRSILIFALTLQVNAEPESEAWDVSSPPSIVKPEKVSISVQEGTWLSLDVSPDGKHIVFDLLGDLYEIGIKGGEARKVTSGIAWDIQPKYSPDGKSVAFISDRGGGDNIWIKDLASGNLRQVTNENFRLLNNPSWSPDGRYILAKKHFTTSRSLGTGEIWLYDAFASQPHVGQQMVARIDEKFQKELGEPRFSSDGLKLYYTQNVTPGNTFIYHEDSNGELFNIMELDIASRKTRVLIGGAGGAVRPVPSSNGEFLAYVKRVRAESRLFVYDLRTGQNRMVFDQLDPDMQETWGVYGLYPDFDWSSDSKNLIFWAQGKIWRLDVEKMALAQIPFSINDTRSIYPTARPKVNVFQEISKTKMVRFASRSPVDNSIVFESLGDLYLKQDQKPPRRLTNDSSGQRHEYHPVWSRNGKFIYFFRWNDKDFTSLHRISSRGGKSTQLRLAKGIYSELAISTDGKELVFRKLSGDPLLGFEWSTSPGIYSYNLGAQKLSFAGESGRYPSTLTDGRILLQLREETAVGRGSLTAKTVLTSRTKEGHNQKKLASAEYATRIIPSPDRSYIAFLDRYHLFVSRISPSSSTIILDASKPAFPTRRVSKVGAAYPTWSSDSTSISWSVGSQFKTVKMSDVFSAEGEIPIDIVDLSIEFSSERPTSKLALVDATIVTMNKGREIIQNGTVLIEGNRIITVGDRDTAVPPDFQIIKLTEKTLLPGFIDAHAHGPYGRNEIIPYANWSLLAHLALGVTTVHDPSSQARSVFTTAEYARAGKILAPRIFSTGEIIYGAKSPYLAQVDALEDALAHVKRLKAQGAISIKNYNQPRREQRQQVNEAARQENMLSVAEGGSLYHMDMSLIIDGSGGIEHNIPTLRIYDDVVQLWSQTDVGYTPTLVVTYGGLTAEDYYYQKSDVWKHKVLSRFVPPSVLQPRSIRRTMAPESDYRDDDAAGVAKKLSDAGVTVNAGAHGQREGLGTHWEMWSLARGGFSPIEAIATATINSASYLGMENELGSIEEGKLADILILSENPLSNIQNTDSVEYIILNGRVYEAQTLAELFSGKTSAPQLYWRNKPENRIL